MHSSALKRTASPVISTRDATAIGRGIASEEVGRIKWPPSRFSRYSTDSLCHNNAGTATLHRIPESTLLD
jgi:hypothetical protein